MKQHIHLITLGVADFARSRKFYTEILGWKPAPGSQDDIVFLQAGGVVLSLYPREKLAEDAAVNPTGSGFPGFSLPTMRKAKPKWMGLSRCLNRKG